MAGDARSGLKLHIYILEILIICTSKWLGMPVRD